MKPITQALPFLSAAALALFAGALLTEAVVLVPLWQSLPAQEFFALHAAHAHRLYGFFAPLTVSATVLAVAAAVAAFASDRSRSASPLAAGVLALVILATYFLYFQQANARFAAASVPAAALPAELARWAAWHWFRTIAGLAALAAALLALGGAVRRP